MNTLLKHATLILLIGSLAYLVWRPDLVSTVPVVCLAIVRSIEVWFNSKTNNELEEKVNEALETIKNTDQLQVDRINRFISVYNGPLARLGTSVDTKQILGDNH